MNPVISTGQPREGATFLATTAEDAALYSNCRRKRAVAGPRRYCIASTALMGSILLVAWSLMALAISTVRPKGAALMPSERCSSWYRTREGGGQRKCYIISIVTPKTG